MLRNILSQFFIVKCLEKSLLIHILNLITICIWHFSQFCTRLFLFSHSVVSLKYYVTFSLFCNYYPTFSTLQVATILVAMATRVLELATKLERKSPAWRLKLTWPMCQELERTTIQSEKKNVLSIKNSLCKASCCGILTNRNGDWIKWNVTR